MSNIIKLSPSQRRPEAVCGYCLDSFVQTKRHRKRRFVRDIDQYTHRSLNGDPAKHDPFHAKCLKVFMDYHNTNTIRCLYQDGIITNAPLRGKEPNKAKVAVLNARDAGIFGLATSVAAAGISAITGLGLPASLTVFGMGAQIAIHGLKSGIGKSIQHGFTGTVLGGLAALYEKVQPPINSLIEQANLLKAVQVFDKLPLKFTPFIPVGIASMFTMRVAEDFFAQKRGKEIIAAGMFWGTAVTLGMNLPIMALAPVSSLIAGTATLFFKA